MCSVNVHQWNHTPALPLASPWMALVVILLFCLAAATFVSHTVASLILMPVIASLGVSLGIPEIAVIGSAFASKPTVRCVVVDLSIGV
jgi:di/tricarboxylate transporter